MKRSKIYLISVSILLVVLVVFGCSAPKTATAPTVTSQPNPVVEKATPTPKETAQPTPTVQNASPSASHPLITITFSAGDQCSIEGPTSIQSGVFRLNVVVDNWEHDKYGLGIGNLAPDKTSNELQDSLNKHVVPDWLNIIDFQEFTQAVGDSFEFTFYSSATKGPLIFSCFWSDPVVGSSSERNEYNFETLGPIPVVKAP